MLRSAVKFLLSPNALGVNRNYNYARYIRSITTYESFVAERRNEKLTWSYVSSPGDVPLLGLTLGQLLQRAADSYGDQTSAVFLHQNIRKSFHQLLQDADQVAAGLLSLGLKRGDRVGIWGSNSYEWFLTQWGAARAGMILVNVNPAYRVNELRYALNLVEVKVLIMAEKFRNQSLPDVLKELIPEPKSSDGDIHLVSTPILPNLERVIVLSDNTFSIPRAMKWSDFLERVTPSLISQVHNLQRRIQFDEAANIQFTSGTTGNPKGATLSHRNIINNGYLNVKGLGYYEKTQILCIPLPLYHGFACSGVMTGAVYGARLVFPSPTYSGRETAKAIHKEKCTHLYGTPTMFVDVLHLQELKEYDLSSLTTTLMGGAPCPLELAKSLNTVLNVKNVMIGYGMTEVSASPFMTKRTDSVERSCSTIGCVTDHFEVKIVDPATREILPVNTPGEVYMRGYGVMLGYWNQPEKTKETITPDGWVQSGDIGILDEYGYGKIVGRIKDMIIRGGENIYPREIEELLHKHPDIKEAQVIGVPDARLGEELCAWIRKKPESQVTEAELKEFCKKEIAYFKVPRYWVFKDTFPTTVTGKVQKFAMRDITIKELGLVQS